MNTIVDRYRGMLAEGTGRALSREPTRVLPPCVTCGSVVFWCPRDAVEVRCAVCVPCPNAVNAQWVAGAAIDDPLATVITSATMGTLTRCDAVSPSLVVRVFDLARQLDQLDEDNDRRSALLADFITATEAARRVGLAAAR